jgi:hypothetical protein
MDINESSNDEVEYYYRIYGAKEIPNYIHGESTDLYYQLYLQIIDNSILDYESKTKLFFDLSFTFFFYFFDLENCKLYYFDNYKNYRRCSNENLSKSKIFIDFYFESGDDLEVLIHNSGIDDFYHNNYIHEVEWHSKEIGRVPDTSFYYEHHNRKYSKIFQEAFEGGDIDDYLKFTRSGMNNYFLDGCDWEVELNWSCHSIYRLIVHNKVFDEISSWTDLSVFVHSYFGGILNSKLLHWIRTESVNSTNIITNERTKSNILPPLKKTIDIAVYCYFLGKLGIENEIELNEIKKSKELYKKYCEIKNNELQKEYYKFGSISKGLTSYRFLLKNNSYIDSESDRAKIENVMNHLIKDFPACNSQIETLISPFIRR